MRTTMLALVILCGALAAPAALAGKPYRERVPLGDPQELPAGLVCPESIAPDGVRLELVGGNQAVMFFENGKFMATARHVDRITNIATGSSVVLELEGVYTDTPQGDGTISGKASGTFAFILFPGDEGPGDTETGRFYVFTGTARFAYDESFAVTEFESVGTRKDVCSMID